MKIEDILHCKDLSILAMEERGSKRFVMAVPHHAPLGVGYLPCPEHSMSDENTGFLGAYTARLLDCPFIVACNYFIDANKDTSSDYFRKIASWQPAVLVELHGHGGDNANHDIEISCGSKHRNGWSKKLAASIRTRMNQHDGLNPFNISGDFKQIFFKARKSLSINTDRWLAFHLEIPKPIRAQDSLYRPFCEMLADSLIEIFPDEDLLGNPATQEQA